MFSVKKIPRTFPYLLSSCVNRWEDIGIPMEVGTAGCWCQLTFYGLNSEQDKANSRDLELNCLQPQIQAICPLICSKYKCWWDGFQTDWSLGSRVKKKKKFLSDYCALGIFYVDSSLQSQEVSNIFILILQWRKPKFERLNSIPKVNQPVSEHRNLTSKAIPLTMALPLRPSGFLSWHFTATIFSH